MKKYKIVVALLLIAICFTSCSKWFDVKPKKMVEQNDLFESENGFKEALTGIYLMMGNRNLYGGAATFGFMDLLAQYYRTESQGEISQQNKLNYQFPSENTNFYIKEIWGCSYNIIANINNLLFFLEKNRHVLSTDGYYEIIKGEALGLRAFLHFDLLRMYGGIYKDKKSSPSIVYRTEFDSNSKQLKAASEIISNIIGDLKEAELLLKDDKMSLEFPKSEFDEAAMEGDKFLVYRHKRMNLYATKALAARVYMYANEPIEAAKYANEVINSKLFGMISNNTENKIYSTEIIFSLYVPEFKKNQTEYFSFGSSYLIDDVDFLNEIFSTPTDGKNDIRYKSYREQSEYFLMSKYDQTNMWASIESTIPLIRLPEMYYILAECETNYDKSSSYINVVRGARGIDEIAYVDEAGKILNLEKEYRKEFAGEGQLFHFYKRRGYKTFLHCPIKDMSSANYTFSLPENEQLFGKVE